MTEQAQMPKVDFNKDKIPEYIRDQKKLVEKDNIRRVIEWKRHLRAGRYWGGTFAAVVLGIYVYTFTAVRRETFLDNFELPQEEF